MAKKIGQKVIDKIKNALGMSMAEVEGADIPEALFKPQGDNNMPPKMTPKQIKARKRSDAARKARKQHRA